MNCLMDILISSVFDVFLLNCFIVLMNIVNDENIIYLSQENTNCKIHTG